jgi:hypothetical protein
MAWGWFPSADGLGIGYHKDTTNESVLGRALTLSMDPMPGVWSRGA